jgi:hypothetical protein
VHPVSTLARGLISFLSDDARLSVDLFSLTPPSADFSWWQANLTATLGEARFHDLSGMAPADGAARIAAEKIDVLVDLNGHTYNSGLAMMAGSPAPIQLTYLGLPETTGNSFISHFVTDALSLGLGGPAQGGAARFLEHQIVRALQPAFAPRPLTSLPTPLSRAGPALPQLHCERPRAAAGTRGVAAPVPALLRRLPTHDRVLLQLSEAVPDRPRPVRAASEGGGGLHAAAAV